MKRVFWTGTALSGAVAANLIFAMAAAAQTPAPAQPGASAGVQDLGELVVTATRQATTVSRTPLSIVAETQKSLDDQGIKTIDDLAHSVPELTLRRSNFDNSPNISVRGITSAVGAPTTGLYLDDTPLQKRFAFTAVTGNGNPFPQIFDLDRIEVLRGPQGTLYGGSSEGGAIRFITPAPSVTNYTGYARAEVSSTEGGAASYEGGAAVGGPLVNNVLGFRASYFYRDQGGYIDHISPYTNQLLATNTNYDKAQVARIALLYQPNSQFSLTPAVYYSYDHKGDTDFFWENTPQYTVPARTSANAGTGFPAYTYPAETYGPYSYGPGKDGILGPSPVKHMLLVPTLTANYQFNAFAVKFISSYIHDSTSGYNNLSGYSSEAANLQAGPSLVVQLPNFSRINPYDNSRTGITEELRISSNPDAAPLSWVGGLFYSDYRNRIDSLIYQDLNQLTAVLRGSNPQVVYGAPEGPGGATQLTLQYLTDKETAAYGEANYLLTSKLKLTAGVRYSHDQDQYSETIWGTLSGFTVPTVQNGGLTVGSQAQSPVTPKVGLTYQATPSDMFYLTAAKGYRPGGVNTTISAVLCGPGLAALGGVPPTTYNSDSVWSYEGGAKVRLLDNHLQLNSSLYYVDWSNVQVNVSLPGCSMSFLTNAAKAVSDGFDVQGQLKVFGGLSLDFSFGYDDARYTAQANGPKPATGNAAIIVYKGDKLPVPPWNAVIGARYDYELNSHYDTYVRGDYQFSSSYPTTAGPGALGYAPDTYTQPLTEMFNLRAGVAFDRWDVSLFAENLFNSQDYLLQTGGRSGCSNPACTTAVKDVPIFTAETFRPRTVGVTASYRF